MYKLDLEKGRGTRDQIANIIEKAWEFKKNIYFDFVDYTKTFDCVDHNKLENSSRGIPDGYYQVGITRWEYQTTLPASW